MSNSFICFIRECVDKVSNVKVPDYIIENVAELIGTLVATVLIAIVTTYIFNRQQEINKVKARVFRYRLNMYEDITRYLEKYDHMMSLSNDREHIIDALSKVNLSADTIDWAVVGMLTEPDEIKNALAEIDHMSIKGIYILDDDVLAKVLILKMYLMNLQQYSILVDSYKSGVKQRKLSETEMKLAKELFFQNYAVIISNEFARHVDALRREIEQKRIHLKEQKSGKNYRKIRRRKKLQDKVFEESVLIKTMPNACFLLGLCVCNAICMEDNDVAVEMKEWVKYVGDILKEREKEV